MISTNLNITPYHDDFDLEDLYFKYLFKSGDTIQTRELNGIQSLLQSQIEKLGNYVFTEGSVVVPGHATADTQAIAIPLNAFVSGVSVDDYIETLKGKEITGLSTKIKAKILEVLKGEDSEISRPTLYIRYMNSSPEDGGQTFVDNEYLEYDGNIIGSVSYVNGVNSTGITAKVQSGIYFVRGLFVETEDQSIIVEQYGNSGSYKIGFFVEETIISALEDPSLFDNALGSENDTVSGADRLKLVLKFGSLDIGTNSNENFIELLRVSNGVVVSKKEGSVKSVVSTELQKSLARTVYNQSGNFVVEPFTVSSKYTLNDFENNGLYKLYTYSADGKLVRTSDTVNPDEINGNKYITLDMSAGEAYVMGFPIVKKNNTLINVNRPNFSQSKNNDTTVMVGGTYIQAPTNIEESVSDSGYENIVFLDNSSIEIGKAKALALTENNKLFISNISFYTKVVVSDATGITNKGIVTGLTSGAKGFIEVVDGTDLYLSNVSGTFSIGETLEFSNFALTPTVSSTESYTNTSVEHVRKSDGTTNIFSTGGDGLVFLYQQKERFAQILEEDNSVVNDLSYYYSKVFSWDGVTPLDNSEPFLGTGLLVNNTSNESINVSIASDGTVSGNGGISDGTIYAKVLKGAPTAKTKTDRINKILKVDSTAIGDFYGTRYTDNEISLGVPSVYDILSVREVNDSANLLTGFSSVTVNDASGLAVGGKIFGVKSDSAVEIVFISLNTVYFVSLNENKFINGESIYYIWDDTLTSLSITGDVVDGYFTEIRDRFDLIENQNDDSYGISYLKLKEDYTKPSSDIVIVYSYHEHGNTGNYFTVSSYSGSYDNLKSYRGLYLSDIIDFRLSPSSYVNNTGVLTDPFTLVQDETLNINSLSFDDTDFVYPDSILTFDHTYYLPRFDVLYLRSDGQFDFREGDYSLEPRVPNSPEDALVLFEIYYPGYIRNLSQIKFRAFSYPRYTMKDIAAIDNRVNNLEYYTTLNLLETEASNFNVLDDAGLNRFKNGFIVDSFNSEISSTADYSNPEFRAAIDAENKELRALHYSDHVELEYSSDTGMRLSEDGKRLTLDYAETPYIFQPFASRTENLNPFGAFDWTGVLNLIPSSDVWVETRNLPAQRINVEGNFTAVARTTNTSPVWTSASGWVTNSAWSSTIRTFSSTSRVARRDWWRGGRLITNTFRDTRTVRNQSRVLTGFRNVVRATFTNTTTTNLVSTEDIDKVRRQYIIINGENLRPNTKLSLFVNNLDMDSEILSSRLKLQNVSGTFTEGQAFDVYRQINNRNTLIAKGQISSWNDIDRILELSELNSPNGTRIATPTDTIPRVGDTITAIDGSSATIEEDLRSSNENGLFNAFFLVPFDRFDTGTMEFLVVNSDNKILGTESALTSSSTRAVSEFPVKGTLNTFRDTIVSVRNAVVDRVRISTRQTRTTVTNTRSLIASRRFDPLAQSFFIELEENSKSTGIFVTSLDLYFATKPTEETSKVKVTIRTVENGTPTETIVPFSTVLKSPSEIATSDDGSLPTKFVFPCPVYLKKDAEYCFVVEPGSSVDYNVFISRLGEDDLITNTKIDKQPYIGSLYKSQNQSVWEPSQFEDLKFDLNKADFSKNSDGTDKSTLDGTLVLTNKEHLPELLLVNPLELTQGSSLVKVIHPNHGMNQEGTNYVQINNVETNIPDGVLGTTITDTNLSGTVVTVTNSANFPASGDLKIGDDIFSYTRSGNQYTLNSYAPGSQHNTGEAVECYTLAGISLRDINSATKTVSQVIDLDSYYITVSTNATASIRFGGNLVTATGNIQYEIITPYVENITPDSTKLSLLLDSYTATSIYNKSTTGVEDSYIFVSADESIKNGEENPLISSRLLASSINATQNGLPNSYSMSLNVNLSSEDANVSPLIDLERCFAITTSNKINYDTTSNDLKASEKTDCVYVTQPISLKTSATSAKILVDMVRYAGNEVQCFIKTRPEGEIKDLSEIDYIEIPIEGEYPISENYNDFRETSYFVDNLPEFREAIIKITMKSKSQALVPRLKRFRGLLLT